MLGLALICFTFVANSVFASLRCNEGPWNVNYTNNGEMSSSFQQWVTHWQHSEEKCLSGTHGYFNFGSGGIGASLSLYAATDFLTALEHGKVYRPSNGSLWADANAKYCTGGVQSLDCYFQTLDSCNKTLSRLSVKEKSFPPSVYSHLETINVCTLGRAAQKPVQWVMGQLIDYIIQPSTDLGYVVRGRIAEVLRHMPANTSMFAVHVRTGSPDQNRGVIDVEHYIRVVDEKVGEAAKRGINVSVVYLASQSNLESFGTMESFNAKMNRPYKFVFLPQYPLPNSHKAEVEDILHDPTVTISRFHLMAEFIADLELFTMAEFFIGSKSTIYITTAALRYARHFERTELRTCFMGRADALCCEGTNDVMSLWRFYYPDAFKGGSYRTL